MENLSFVIMKGFIWLVAINWNLEYGKKYPVVSVGETSVVL